jgi:hypothetical protein
MSETIQMRTTQEESGDYRVYAAKGDNPIKGLAIHHDITSRLDSAEYVEVSLVEGEGAVTFEAYGATSATVKIRSGTAARNGYVEPRFLQGYDSSFSFDGKDTDLDSMPTFAIESISASDESTYDDSQSTSADDAAEALFGDSDDSEATEADSEEDEEETVEVSDEEIDIAT